MESESDIQDWNANAAEYSQKIEENPGGPCFSQIREHFWRLLGEIRGKQFLDLGCGQGWLTKELTNRGADVTGIDGSSALIERARQLCPKQLFHVADLALGLPNLTTKYDVVVSHMVVMDIPKIQGLFKSVSQVLKPGGIFLFTLPHPCFFMQKSFQDETKQWFKKVTSYLVPEVWRIETFGGHNHYHRTISEYANALSEAGLFVCDLYEPPHESNSNTIDPKFLKTFPVFMMITSRKPW